MPEHTTGTAKKPVKSQPHPPVSINLYRNLALSFGVSVILLVLVVLIVTFAKTEITIFPKDQPLSVDLSFDIGEDPDPGALKGFISETLETKEKTYPVTGSSLVDKQAGGKVIIYNKQSRKQTLVATTRLLSREGVLFRLKNLVNVNPRSQVEAEVYADQLGSSGNLAPTSFTIPGLSGDAQKLVYAESKAPMTGGQVSAKIVIEDDLARAHKELADELRSVGELKLQEKLNKLEPADPQYVYISEILEGSSDVPPSKEAENFKVKDTVHVVGVVFSREEMKNRVEQSMAGLVPAHRNLEPPNFADLNISIENYNVKEGQAKLKVRVSGRVKYLSSAPELSKEKFFGLTKDGIGQYLKGFDGVNTFKVSMPLYLRKVPNDEKRVKVIVK